MKNKVYILTAVHNNLADTQILLKCIFKQTYKNYEVYVVDDGSMDDTSNFIHKNYPLVNILKGDGNLWWTGSLNLGLMSIFKKAKAGDFVWTINNDCFFVKTTLGDVFDYAIKYKDKKVIIGSKVYDHKTEKIVDAGVNINWQKLTFSKTEEEKKIDALSTKGTLYPVQIFKKIGLFDAKNFPHYFSDYEFSIRAKRNGFKLLICDECKIYNKTERTGVQKFTLGTFLSKKSKVNIFTQLNIVRFVCPPEYRLKAFGLLLLKLVNAK